MQTETLTEIQVYEFWDFLTSEWHERGAHLTPEQAFSVVYALQEDFHVIPDSWEMCDHCKCLVNTYNSGFITVDEDAVFSDYHFSPGVIEMGGRYCDNCAVYFEIPYSEREEDQHVAYDKNHRILEWFKFIDADQAQAHPDGVREAGA